LKNILVALLLLLPSWTSTNPTVQEFNYETSLWVWNDTLEVIQHPDIRIVTVDLTIRGKWWIAVEALNPTDEDGRLFYKSSVSTNLFGNEVVDASLLTCVLNGPFDGKLDWGGTSGRVARDMKGKGVTFRFLLDPTSFIGTDIYHMPISGYTDHEIVIQGGATQFGFYQEITQIHLILKYELY